MDDRELSKRLENIEEGIKTIIDYLEYLNPEEEQENEKEEEEKPKNNTKIKEKE